MSPPNSLRSKSRSTRSIARRLKWSTTYHPGEPPPVLPRISDGRIQNPNSFHRPAGTDHDSVPSRLHACRVRSTADRGSRVCGSSPPTTRIAVTAISRLGCPATPGGLSGTAPENVVGPFSSTAP